MDKFADTAHPKETKDPPKLNKTVFLLFPKLLTFPVFFT